MKILLRTLLLVLVLCINFSGGIDQPPHGGQPPNERRRRRDFETADHDAMQRQSRGDAKPGGGHERPLLNQEPIRNLHFHDFFSSGSNPSSSSLFPFADTPRPRPRLDNVLAGLPLQRGQMHIRPPGPVHTTASVEPTIQGHQNQPNAANNPGTSSGTKCRHGGFRVGAGRPRGAGRKAPFHPGEVFKKPLTRQHDKEVSYMGKTVFLWLYPRITPQVEQAEFKNMIRPYGPNFFQNMNFLVRLDNLDNLYPTVIYLWQNGTIMGVRAPKITNADVMEPTQNMWFIVFCRKYFRLLVAHSADGPKAEAVDLAARNGRPLQPNDKVVRADFPYNITLCVYKDGRTNIQGAFIPGFVNNQWRGC